jgi:uridylate kinase
MLRYKRVLIKLSGGAIAGHSDGSSFDAGRVQFIVDELLSAKDLGVEIVIVIGGGNIFRGRISEQWSIDRVEADSMGMLATVLNSIMLRAAIKARGEQYEARVMTAIPMEWVAEPYIRLRAVRHLEKGYIIILAGGIGQPFVTTDYPAVQRALETHSEAILVAKHGVDGIYTEDPRKVPTARRYASLSYDECIKADLKVMDQSALALAREYGACLHVFDFDRPGSIRAIVTGEKVGTYVSADSPCVFAE